MNVLAETSRYFQARRRFVGVLAAEFGAKLVVKNGPQRWSMDEVSLMLSEPVTIAGVPMAYGSRLPAGTMNIPKYTVFEPAKTQNVLYKAGLPTYRLVVSVLFSQ